MFQKKFILAFQFLFCLKKFKSNQITEKKNHEQLFDGIIDISLFDGVEALH